VSRTTVVLAYQRLARRRPGREPPGQRHLGAAPRRGARDVARSTSATARYLGDSLARAAAVRAGRHDRLHGCLPAGASVPLDEEWRARKATSPRSPRAPATRRRAGRRCAARSPADFERRGVPTTPDEILITTGAQQRSILVARLLVARDASVVLEDPTYLGAIDVFALAGARLVPVPVGTTGVALCTRSRRRRRRSSTWCRPTRTRRAAVLAESDRREIAVSARSRARP
jgi:2-aminoadipate transaminase